MATSNLKSPMVNNRTQEGGFNGKAKVQRVGTSLFKSDGFQPKWGVGVTTGAFLAACARRDISLTVTTRQGVLPVGCSSCSALHSECAT